MILPFSQPLEESLELCKKFWQIKQENWVHLHTITTIQYCNYYTILYYSILYNTTLWNDTIPRAVEAELTTFFTKNDTEKTISNK